MALPISLCLFVALVCAYAWWSRSRRAVRVAASTPTLAGCWPLIGHAHHLLGVKDSTGTLKYMQDISSETNANGGVMKGWFGPSLFYVVTDPDDALTVLNSCLKKHYFYRFAKPFIGDGLLVARSVASWKRHRKLLVPAFSAHTLADFLGVFNEQSRALADNMATELQRGPFDHWPYLAANALETICRTALGMPETGETVVTREYGRACQQMLSIIVRRLSKPWWYWDGAFRWSRMHAEQDQLVEVFQKMSTLVMEKSKLRIKEEEGTDDIKSGRRFKALMDLLVELGAEGALSDREIREEVDTMIIAGHDTSSTSLLFTLLILGAHPRVQDRVYDELKEVFGASDRDVTKDDLHKLVYMEAVLKESLRHYPVGPMVLRYAEKDCQLKNCTVAAGSTVIASLWGIHRHQCWGEDVEEFRPERWLEGGQCVNGAFAAFSLGRRGCIGKSYALMSMKTTLVHLVRRYRFRAELAGLQLKLDILLKISSGGKLAIDRR